MLGPLEHGRTSEKPLPTKTTVSEHETDAEKARVAVIVSGNGTNLQALLDQEKAGNLPHANIALVIADNEAAGGFGRAEKAHVKTSVIPRRRAKAITNETDSKNPSSRPTNISDFETELIATLEENQIDMVVLAGFLGILSPNFFAHFHGPVINIHPSLIPSFCGKGFYGLHVHEAALKTGVKVSGATVHFVNEVVDDGKIIAQKAVEVKEDDTPKTLQRRIMEEAEWILLPQATEDVAATLCSSRSERG